MSRTPIGYNRSVLQTLSGQLDEIEQQLGAALADAVLGVGSLPCDTS